MRQTEEEQGTEPVKERKRGKQSSSDEQLKGLHVALFEKERQRETERGKQDRIEREKQSKRKRE